MWIFGITLAALAAVLAAERGTALVDTGIPRITLSPKTQGALERGVASFFCAAVGTPAPSYRWEKRRKGRRTMTLERIKRYEIIDTDRNMSVLRINPVHFRWDDAVFACIAYNANGESRSEASLSVYRADSPPSGYPRFSRQPSLKAVERGRSTLLPCEATGDPQPTIAWLKNRLPVNYTSDGRVKLLESGEWIANSQSSDEGQYECVAENQHGAVYSYPATLYVKERRVPPYFTKEPENVEVRAGSDVTITCEAEGSPTPYVKWRQGSNVLTLESNIPMRSNVLRLTDVRQSANYTCEASNNLGRIESRAQVAVKGTVYTPASVFVKGTRC
ncbi:hypothetical protein BaRGS_00025252 [Batillaria attramentaria]|uniref:protein-tyrosine-phosphatase n=1 Tax=Batillaria attramentaria TaxID=370345 RepID=A0ABD0K8R8_9CAEN